MRKYLKLLFILCFVFQACNALKTNMKSKGNYEVAIENAIIDFSNASSLVKDDSTFVVNFKEIDDRLIGVNLSGTVGKFIITQDGNSSRLPNNYIIYNGKLFYWYDEKTSANQDVINKLNEYNLIDYVNTIADAEFIRDDGKKGAAYYFCKNNLQKYKKIITTKAIGDYKLPKLNCQ